MQGTIQNRDAFLENVAKRLGRARKVQLEAPKWQYNPREEYLNGASQDELLEVFKKNGTGVNCEVVVTKKDEAAQAVFAGIKDFGGGPVITWKDSRYEELFGLGSFSRKIFRTKTLMCSNGIINSAGKTLKEQIRPTWESQSVKSLWPKRRPRLYTATRTGEEPPTSCRKTRSFSFRKAA